MKAHLTVEVIKMHYSENRSELINEMMDKYGYLYCQKCGQNHCGFKFETHHIVFRSEAPDHPMLHSKRNLIIVGSDCHRDFHRDKSNRNKLVVDRDLETLFGISLIR